MNAYPITQADRDVVEDVGLADLDDRVGTRDHAHHNHESVAS